MSAPAPRDYVLDVVLAERFGGWSEIDRLPLWRLERLLQFLAIEAQTSG